MEHILSLSYGKDSLACLGAIDQLGWPLDRIVHADGHTVHDFDERFRAEEAGLIPTNRTFRWAMIQKIKLDSASINRP